MEFPSVPHLVVEVDSDKCCARIRLDGEVDIASADQVRVAAIEAIHLDSVEHLIVDCRELDFLDSTGVRTLLEAHKSFDGKVALVNPKRAVTRVLDVTGLDGMFSIAASFEAAQDALHEA